MDAMCEGPPWGAQGAMQQVAETRGPWRAAEEPTGRRGFAVFHGGEDSSPGRG